MKFKNVFGFDSEDDSKLGLKMICVYGQKENIIYVRTEKVFYNVDDFIKFVDDLKEPSLFAAINLEYDLVNCFRENFDKLKLSYNGSSLIWARMKNKNKVTINFIDVLNHIRKPAAEIGELFGLEKLPFDPDNVEYCMRDAEIAYTAIEFLIDFYFRQGGELKYTAPASSLNIFLKKYCNINFRRLEDDKINAGLQESYYGGRTECHRIGEVHDNIFYYDVNSLYPYVMKKNYYPIIQEPKIIKESDHDMHNLIFEFEGAAYVEVEAKENVLPLLPYRLNNRLIFPTGKFSGWYAFPELRHFISRELGILKFRRSIIFINRKKVFRNFVDDFYSLRLSDGKKSFFYKLLMNSLYGKFAQIGNVTMLVNEKIQGSRIIDGKCLKQIKLKPPYFANIIWSSQTTSLARCLLYKFLTNVKREDLLYCDTDSIIFKGLNIFKDSKILGDIKLVGEFDYGNFIGAKTYILKNSKTGAMKIACKGIRKSLRQKYIEEGQVFFESPIRLRESCRRNLPANLWIGRLKQVKQDYSKGIVLKSGKVIPFKLEGE